MPQSSAAFVKAQAVGPLGGADSIGLGWGQRICIAKKFPSDAGPGTRL